MLVESHGLAWMPPACPVESHARELHRLTMPAPRPEPRQPGRCIDRPGYRWLLAFRGYGHWNTIRYRVKHG
jgi:hypothetical protein